MFSFDLKRLYYGAVAFLVFLVAFFAAQMLASSLVRLPILASVPFEERHPPVPTPLPPPPATAVPMAGTPAPPPAAVATVTPEQPVPVQEKELTREDWELRWAKESVASTLAIVLVALPVWWWHWRRWRALTRSESAQFFRLYVYAMMLIALVVAIGHSASALGKVFTWLLGITDFTTRHTQLVFTQELVSSIVNALIALLAWWYHWSNVRENTEH
ncbi:MAG: DUF5671 domain-containing protein [Anaerolineae bacterium]|nr:DUF5671 domain-containing protein [Anaerolineae bacterium]